MAPPRVVDLNEPVANELESFGRLTLQLLGLHAISQRARRIWFEPLRPEGNLLVQLGEEFYQLVPLPTHATDGFMSELEGLVRRSWLRRFISSLVRRYRRPEQDAESQTWHLFFFQVESYSIPAWVGFYRTELGRCAVLAFVPDFITDTAGGLRARFFARMQILRSEQA